MTFFELLGAAASLLTLLKEGRQNRKLRRTFQRLRDAHGPGPLREVLGLSSASERSDVSGDDEQPSPRLAEEEEYYSRPTRLPPRDAIPRQADEPEETYEALRTYASLSPAERDDFALLEAAHDARCKAAIRSAGVEDPQFQALCDEALDGEDVTAVDLRGATAYRERLPENCTLATRIDGGVLIGPSWAVCWALRRSGLYIAGDTINERRRNLRDR